MTRPIKCVRKKLYYLDENGKLVHDDYYPKLTFKVKMVREPFPRILMTFVPMYILAMIQLTSFRMASLGDRMGTLSLCMLTQVSLMEGYRQSLPDLKQLTFADKVILF